MNIKDKVKSYSFWVSLSSALILIIKVIGNKFGFTIDATLASDLITSLCSILVVTGIIVTPTPKSSKQIQEDAATVNIDSSLAIKTKSEVETQNIEQTIACEEHEKVSEQQVTPEEPVVETTSNINQDNQTCNTFLSFENGFQSQKSKIDDDVKLYIKLLENEIIKLEDSMKDK